MGNNKKHIYNKYVNKFVQYVFLIKADDGYTKLKTDDGRPAEDILRTLLSPLWGSLSIKKLKN